MLRTGSVTVDLLRGVVLRSGGREEHLTSRELEVVERLADAPGHRLSREVLEAEVWGLHPDVRSDAVPVAMRRLRAKLGRDALRTVRGVGWALAVADAVPTAPVWAASRPLVGREALLEHLDGLAAQGWRWMTLRGPPGVGATQLALTWLGRRPVPVVATRVPGDPLTAVADALGVEGSAPETLALALAGRGPMACLVDGLALDPATAERMAELVERTPQVLWVATAHRAGPHPAQQLVEVPPLEVDASVRLLRDLLPTGATASDARLVSVAASLDGLPGAMLLHARAAALGLEALEASVARHPQGPLADAVARVVAGLDAEARAALAQLARFGDHVPFDLAARFVELPVLMRLAEASLVHHDGGRLHLLGGARRAASAVPAEVGPAFEALLVDAEAAIEAFPRRPGEAMERLRALRGPLLACSREGVGRQRGRALAVLGQVLYDSGPIAVGLEAFRRASAEALEGSLEARCWGLALQRRDGRAAQGIETDLEGIDHPLAQLLRGMCAGQRGDAREAVARYDALPADAPAWIRARAGSRAVGHEGRRALAGDATWARIEATLALVDREGLELLRPFLVGVAAQEHAHEGRLDEALALLGDALRRARAAGVPDVQRADLWNALGVVQLDHDLAAARDAFDRADGLARRAGVTSAAPFGVNRSLAAFLADDPATALAGMPHDLLGFMPPNLVGFAHALEGACHIALGDALEGRMALAGVPWGHIGKLFSVDGDAHGAALRAAFEAEAHVVALPAPSAREALEQVVAQARSQARPRSAHALRLLLRRLERRLSNA